MVWKIFLMRKSSFDGFLFFIAIFQRALAGMFLEDTAEISLVMVTAHLSDLTDRKRRLIEKQLLCITRVMLCLPPMLILDEATSSIDTRTELMVQEAFDRLMEGRTSFIVAHRLSTIRNADEILVMKDGSIIEQGSHEELMAKGGFFQNLYNSQFVKVAE